MPYPDVTEILLATTSMETSDATVAWMEPGGKGMRIVNHLVLAGGSKLHLCIVLSRLQMKFHLLLLIPKQPGLLLETYKKP